MFHTKLLPVQKEFYDLPEYVRNITLKIYAFLFIFLLIRLYIFLQICEYNLNNFVQFVNNNYAKRGKLKIKFLNYFRILL